MPPDCEKPAVAVGRSPSAVPLVQRMEIETIQQAIRGGQVRITDHADEEASSDGLSLDEIYASVKRGEVIEDYPSDRPYPSCLIYGPTDAGDPVHSVWA